MLAEPYLLILNIELYRHDGQLWAEPLWHKDLLLHLDGIAQLTLLCPVRDAAPPADWLACAHPRLRIASLPPLGRLAALRIPSLAARLWRAIGAAGIVHVGVAGWPFPLGWIAVPIARLRRRFLLIVIESSFWRMSEAGAPRRKRWAAALFEAINRACVNAADVSFFTTDAYARELATHPRGPAIVAPASWLDDDQIASPTDLADRTAPRPPRLLYAGRLTAAKGVGVLLDAVRRSRAEIDIVGHGDLAAQCSAVAAAFPERVRMIDPVPYGRPFSSLLDRYDAIVVPSLSDEQPRIIFDAFARALPVIASDRPGHTALVRPGETGWLVPANDAAALAAAMDAAYEDAAACRSMGSAACEIARTHTHAAMHRQRVAIIADLRTRDAR